MKGLLVSAFAVGVGVLTLRVFYSAIKTGWPENYVSATGDFGVVVNRTLVKYAAFRLVPVYAVALLVSKSSVQFGGHPMYVAILMGLAHIALTNFWHLVRIVRRGKGSHTRTAAILVDLVTMAGVLSAATLAGFGTGPLTAIVPPLDEFFKSFWTTAVVAALAVYLTNLSRATRATGALVERSQRELGPLVEAVREAAKKAGVDVTLAEAVLLTENLERPGWVRSFERSKARLFPQGTYGVMQVYGDAPIDDGASIAEGVNHLRSVPLQYRDWGAEPESIEAALRHYNNDDNFVSLARQIFYEIQRPPEHPKAGSGDQPPREVRLKERIDLTTSAVSELVKRMQTAEGITSIATANIQDLRSLAEIVKRLPVVTSEDERNVKTLLEERLTGEEMPGAANSAQTTDGVVDNSG